MSVALEFAVAEVRQLGVGQALAFSVHRLPMAQRDGVTWGPGDLVLEKVTGSAFEFTAELQFPDGILFQRWPPCPEGFWRWVSPDRRHLFEQTPNGLWRRTWATCQGLFPRSRR